MIKLRNVLLYNLSADELSELRRLSDLIQTGDKVPFLGGYILPYEAKNSIWYYDNRPGLRNVVSIEILYNEKNESD